jgi:hypothetical protein
MAEDLEQLIYVSSASRLMTDAELIDLLNVARDKNARLDVSGMLVYCDGTFIQVLEGKSQTLKDLFWTIEHDSRHKCCFILLRQKITQRAFEAWAMGFRAISQELADSITGYVDFFGDRPVPEKGAAAYTLLNSFREQHDRELHYSAH